MSYFYIFAILFYIFSFHTRKTGFDARDDRYGIFVDIIGEVEIIASKFNIEFLTLMTRIGGIIGVGKEFLWISLSIYTLFISILSGFFKSWK